MLILIADSYSAHTMCGGDIVVSRQRHSAQRQPGTSSVSRAGSNGVFLRNFFEVLWPRWSVPKRPVTDGHLYWGRTVEDENGERFEYQTDIRGLLIRVNSNDSARVKQCHDMFLDSGKASRLVRKIKLFGRAISEKAECAPCILRTIDSEQVKVEQIDALGTPCLKPIHRLMLKDPVMKVWFLSFWTGATIAVLIVAEKLYDKFVRPYMEKTTRRLIEELGEDDDDYVEATA